MRRIVTTLAAACVVAGCAATPTPKASRDLATIESFRVDPTPVSRASLETDAALLQGPDLSWGGSAALATTPSPSYPSTSSALAAALAMPFEEGRRSDGDNYFAAKGGVLYPNESDLDTGYIINAAYGRYFTRLVSLELEAGYAASDPDAPDSDLSIVPVMLNGRLNVPLWILEVYGGVGIGTVYYDIEVGSFDDNDWLWAGSAFLGANLVLLDKLTGGLELKYYVTDEIHHTNDTLDALAVMLTLGWRF